MTPAMCGLCEAYLEPKEERPVTDLEIAELREAAYDYARLIQVERCDRDDIAVHRAYEQLREALGGPVGLYGKPQG